MSGTSPLETPRRPLLRLVGWLADLRLAIILLLLIAVASGVGTAIPQQEDGAFYHQRYDDTPWLGWLKADGLLRFQLDHVYSSGWFLALLALLGLALLLCSWRRQWPALRASLRWIDYTTPRQLSKLHLAETIPTVQQDALAVLATHLRRLGWSVLEQRGRLAARKGLVGKVGPLLVHAGMVVLMVGAAWGALAGQRLERFLAPGHELELLDRQGRPQVTLALDRFVIARDPAGRPEQFTSSLRLIPPALSTPPAAAPPTPPSTGQSSSAPSSSAQSAAPSTSARTFAPPSSAVQTAPTELSAPTVGDTPLARQVEISVNHPLRYQGMTLYQADWTLAALQIQLGRSPVLELPLQRFPQLGEQVWGLLLPTRPDGSQPVLLTLTSEQGPVEVFAADGSSLGTLRPDGDSLEVRGLPIRVAGIVPASGLLFKRDPGVPLVYGGFAIALLGGGLSLVATRQLWVVEERRGDGLTLHAGGLCNRQLTGFARELPALLALIRPSAEPDADPEVEGVPVPPPVSPQQG
ncbi:MAG: cytochrome c biogenesis protein ResB [Cyanobacteriota bacterium]|nr:cytochrome c biogenesis protein ResB [Cyanobacteriota bacterium]